MNHPPLILTFDGNPVSYAHGGDSTWDDDVVRTATGEPTNPIPWNVSGLAGDRVRNGTRVFLLRQRTVHPGGRGVIAAGHVVNGTVRQGKHWEDPTKTQRYLDVIFDRVLPADQPLPYDDLRQFIPGHDWKYGHRKSGFSLTDRRDAALLEALWSVHLAVLDETP